MKRILQEKVASLETLLAEERESVYEKIHTLNEQHERATRIKDDEMLVIKNQCIKEKREMQEDIIRLQEYSHDVDTRCTALAAENARLKAYAQIDRKRRRCELDNFGKISKRFCTVLRNMNKSYAIEDEDEDE